MAAKNSHYQVRALERALDILAVFSLEQPELTLSELATATKLPPSTTLRLLSILAQYGYVDRSDDTDRYRIGVGMFERGSIYIQTTSLEAQALEPLTTLAHTYNQTASLAVLDGDEIVHIAVVQPDRAIRYFAPVGQREMVHCTGLGKALLSGLSNDDLVSILGKRGLPARSQNTITTMDALRAELDMIRTRGYAIDDEESLEGLRCIAAPIFDDRGRIVAAISASGAAGEFNDVTNPQLIDAVREAAGVISERLGHKVQQKVSA